MGCGEQVTTWHYFIQSSFALHSLHFELSRISLGVSLDSVLYHLLLRQSSITVHVRRSTNLLFIISWCTFHKRGRLRPKGTSFKHHVLQRVEKTQVEVCERRGKSFIKYFKGPFIKMLRRNTPYGKIIYMLIQLKVTRKWAEDLLSYRFILTKQIYEKGKTLQWKIHERVTFCQK